MSDVLNCPMEPSTNDAGADSVRKYLVLLLETLWQEDEGFSGKRPFGNSDWQDQVYEALVRGGLLAGTLDEEEGYFVECDWQTGSALVLSAIRELAVTS